MKIKWIIWPKILSIMLFLTFWRSSVFNAEPLSSKSSFSGTHHSTDMRSSDEIAYTNFKNIYLSNKFSRKGKQVNNFYVKHKANLIFSKFTVTTSTRWSFSGLAPATGDKPYSTVWEEGCTIGCIKFLRMKDEYGICPGHISTLQKWTQNLFLSAPHFTQFNYVSKLI